MNDLTKNDKNNVSLIFDAKKESINFTWMHYCGHPVMKAYLVHERIGDNYSLRDTRTNKIIMSASFPLNKFLK